MAKLVYQAVTKRWNEINKFTNILIEQFISGSKIILENCLFQYKWQFYKQLFGSPMGSPLSSVLVDLVS